MNTITAIGHEMQTARSEGFIIMQVRVTPSALPGAVFSFRVDPILSEREVLVHPEDWAEVVEEARVLTGANDPQEVHVDTIWGVPVA